MADSGSYFKYGSSSLNAGVPEQRSSSYIIISVDEITTPASRILPSPDRPVPLRPGADRVGRDMYQIAFVQRSQRRLHHANVRLHPTK